MRVSGHLRGNHAQDAPAGLCAITTATERLAKGGFFPYGESREEVRVVGDADSHGIEAQHGYSSRIS
jgi:hypothetical protein